MTDAIALTFSIVVLTSYAIIWVTDAIVSTTDVIVLSSFTIV